MKSISLSQAIARYLAEAQADRLSSHTIADYTNSYRKLQAYLVSDRPLAGITVDDLLGFFADLASAARAPGGVAARPARPIGAKQQLNIHTGLSALWSWAIRRGYVERHIVHEIRRPRPDKPAIIPLTQADLKAILAQCDRSIGYARAGQRVTDYQRPTGLRDRAIIIMLVDTGVRASELCELRLRDIDLRNARITVTGKGRKQRTLPLGPTCLKALSRYISEQRSEALVNEPLFLGVGSQAMTRDALLKLVKRLGDRAGIEGVHPHRFRHTFAIQYLRNGGNTRALQEALGHETLEMIRTYTAIAEADLVNGHRTASPAENWRL
jgi:integrase/recombinase XerD